ncbi:hypothetical protein V497_08616, partial [Pseudogymnoascus sp. VKM F-4516 (FW-969)]
MQASTEGETRADKTTAGWCGDVSGENGVIRLGRKRAGVSPRGTTPEICGYGPGRLQHPSLEVRRIVEWRPVTRTGRTRRGGADYDLVSPSSTSRVHERKDDLAMMHARCTTYTGFIQSALYCIVEYNRKDGR